MKPHSVSLLRVFADLTRNLATISKCEDRKIAAIIADDDLSQVLSIGINGGPKGGTQCLCNTDGKYGCVHAEVNALIKCRSDVANKVMFVTMSPCKQCAASIINAPGSFSVVYILDRWKDPSGEALLAKAGIDVVQLL